MDEAPEVSVLIVNYNGRPFLRDCIASVRAALSGYRIEIVVVDNLSSDGSVELLRQLPGIVLIESPSNLGFSGGNNLAARHARGETYLLLNNDTVVRDSLAPLIEAAKRTDVGAAGCRLVYRDGRLQTSIGYAHSPARVALSWLGLGRLHWLPSVFRRTDETPGSYARSHDDVDWVSGACLATSASAWSALEGLDERFFMYCEDVDYCLRAKQNGYTVSFVADATVVHFEGAGRPWIGEAALLRTARSYRLFLGKHYPGLRANLALFLLGLIFVLRSTVLALLAIGARDPASREIRRDKARGFRRAGSLLLSGNDLASSLPGPTAS